MHSVCATVLVSVHGHRFSSTYGTWADVHGATVRCPLPQRTGVGCPHAMGFTPTRKLPEGSRLGTHGVGNADPMAAAIMRCAFTPLQVPHPTICREQRARLACAVTHVQLQAGEP